MLLRLPWNASGLCSQNACPCATGVRAVGYSSQHPPTGRTPVPPRATYPHALSWQWVPRGRGSPGRARQKTGCGEGAEIPLWGKQQDPGGSSPGWPWPLRCLLEVPGGRSYTGPSLRAAKQGSSCRGGQSGGVLQPDASTPPGPQIRTYILHYIPIAARLMGLTIPRL